MKKKMQRNWHIIIVKKISFVQYMCVRTMYKHVAQMKNYLFMLFITYFIHNVDIYCYKLKKIKIFNRNFFLSLLAYPHHFDHDSLFVNFHYGDMNLYLMINDELAVIMTLAMMMEIVNLICYVIKLLDVDVTIEQSIHLHHELIYIINLTKILLDQLLH